MLFDMHIIAVLNGPFSETHNADVLILFSLKYKIKSGYKRFTLL